MLTENEANAERSLQDLLYLLSLDIYAISSAMYADCNGPWTRTLMSQTKEAASLTFLGLSSRLHVTNKSMSQDLSHLPFL